MQGLRISPGLLPPECEALRAEVRGSSPTRWSTCRWPSGVRNWAGSNPEFSAQDGARAAGSA